MAGKAKYLMIASMDVDPEHDAIFNEVYDQEHVPNLRKVPGVVGDQPLQTRHFDHEHRRREQDHRDPQ